MALVRCEQHGRPAARTRTYRRSVKPVGYRKTAAICGLAGCTGPGLVCHDEDDEAQWRRGKRIFTVPNAAIKVAVEA